MTAKLVISEHDQLGGLGVDDHLQYLLLGGRAGGQVAIGGTLTTQTLILQDNVADANQLTFGPGISAGLLDLQTGGHDLNARHVGFGSRVATNTHIIIGQEIFSGITGARNAIGLFPYYQMTAPGAGNLYAVQGNCFFGGDQWLPGSNINPLQFFPAPDYDKGSTVFGNSNLTLMGISTGGCINVLGKTITAKDMIGLSVVTFSSIFDVFGPTPVSADRAIGVIVAAPYNTTGTIDHQEGIRIEPQSYGTANRGLWLAGDGEGSDLCFGSGVRGTGDTFTKIGNDVQLFDAAGLFTAAMVGKKIVTRGATSPGNNGAFIIHTYIGPTQIRWANQYAGSSEGFPGTWQVGMEHDARIYYDGSDLIIDPDFLTAGDRVLIGATGDDDMLLNDIEIDGALNHDGAGVGFFGTAPAVQAAAYTPTNVAADRSYDANATTVNELADVLGTLIADLQSYGLLQ